jgi:hypothetical protein
VLGCFNSEFTTKIYKITYKTDKNTNIFVILEIFVVNSEHTVASYKSNDFTWKFWTVHHFVFCGEFILVHSWNFRVNTHTNPGWGNSQGVFIRFFWTYFYVFELMADIAPVEKSKYTRFGSVADENRTRKKIFPKQPNSQVKGLNYILNIIWRRISRWPPNKNTL